MPIKLHRTQPFLDGAEQGQSHFLDKSCLNQLSELDRIVCDRNRGRPQPDSPFQEIEDWYNDGRYWSDAYNTRWNVAVTLYYMATHPDASDFGDYLAQSLDYRDDWSHWNTEKKTAVAASVLHIWRWLLRQPAEGSGKESSWRTCFAGRFFEFAQALNILDRDMFADLFRPSASSNQFLHDCLFVSQYWERIRDPADPWMQHLPSRSEIRAHLQRGFFAYPQHQAVASAAEETVAWKTFGCELLDD